MKINKQILSLLIAFIFVETSFAEKPKVYSWHDGKRLRKIYLKPDLFIDFSKKSTIKKRGYFVKKFNLNKDKKVFFIDFGLGYTSTKTEDMAVDLLNLKKTLQATHSKLFENGWKNIVEGYLSNQGKQEVITHIQKVENRARYK